MKTIKEKNRMIAEFMGYETYEQTDNVAIRLMDGNEFNSTDIGHVHAKFHTSWDWLMPVVYKIYDALNDEWYAEHDSLSFSLFPSSIDELYVQAVEFIEWYNNLVELEREIASDMDRDSDM